MLQQFALLPKRSNCTNNVKYIYILLALIYIEPFKDYFSRIKCPLEKEWFKLPIWRAFFRTLSFLYSGVLIILGPIIALPNTVPQDNWPVRWMCCWILNLNHFSRLQSHLCKLFSKNDLSINYAGFKLYVFLAVFLIKYLFETPFPLA